MPTKTKKVTKVKTEVVEPDETKPLKNVKETAEMPPKPSNKVTVEEIETQESEQPESVIPEAEPVSGTSSDTESSPEITSFSQLDTQSQVPTPSKEIPTKSILEPEKEFSNETEVTEEKKEDKYETEDKTPKGEGKSEISSDEIKEWLKEVRPDTTKEVEKSSGSNLGSIFIVLVILLLLGLAGGGIYYYRTKIVKSPPKTEPSTTQADQPTSTPTSTPSTEEVDYTKYSLRVLNGSGVTGEAGRVAKLFEEFKFKEVTTGNADKSDFTTTTVSLKADVPETAFEVIKDTLSESYTVEKSQDNLEASSPYDVVVTVGTKKSE